MKRKVWLLPLLAAVAVATVVAATQLPQRSLPRGTASCRIGGSAGVVAHAVTAGAKVLVWLVRP